MLVGGGDPHLDRWHPWRRGDRWERAHRSSRKIPCGGPTGTLLPRHHGRCTGCSAM
ncbi:hypothetical protein BQ8420_07960 [Nocardiopsis sp. JB363]|nr:hypothetical protein BQ8420_07960 [Nocardiopsis sp. JB363]